MKIKAADLFCGAGGTSTGLVEACEELGHKVHLTAINHWNVAVATHTANHPDARHLCASLDSLNPRDMFKEGELDVLWASPECTHHSIARGGKPINDQSRATAWCVIRWAEALKPGIILVENVKEFLTWGPITSAGQKDKQKLGKIFLSWVGNLEALGYRVDWQILCAADYGDPTTRKRLFVQAVRGRRKIVWPEPTHSPGGDTDMFGSRKTYCTARSHVIDWSLQGSSVFARKKPLAAKTMRRILIGLEKFGLAPLIVPKNGFDERVRSTDKPLQTVCTEDRGIGIAQPYLVKMRGTNDAADINKPAPTVTGSGQNLALAEPYLVQVNHGNGADKNGDKRRVRSTKEPLPTVAGNRGEWAVCNPMLITVDRPETNRSVARPVDEPVPTVTGSKRIALAQPYLIAIDHKGGNGSQTRSADQPLSSVTTKQRHAVCQPFLIGKQSGAKPRSVENPAPTFSTAGAISLVQPYLVKFYGNEDGGHPVDQPVGTVTTKDRFGLCQPMVEIEGEKYLVDILFRMLKPHELAAAQGFPRDYKFTGTTTQIVKQIGNAVPKNLAKAIVRAVLTQTA